MAAVHAMNGSEKPECGQTGRVSLAMDRSNVTCKRCLVLLDLAEKQSEGQAVEVRNPEQRDYAIRQEEAVRAEENFTRREVMSFIHEGDLEAAIYRMQRGFDRVVRLSGLGRAVREAEQEKETICG